jgi:hypothetical protein
VTAIVHGLEREYGDRVGVTIENATTSANAERIRNEFGFKSHGLVVYDKSGQLKEKLDGHLLKEPEIRSALERVLAAP